METLFIVISIAILLFIFASFSEKKRKEDVLNDWRSRYTSEDYVPPVIHNKFSSNVVSSDGTGNEKSSGNEDLDEYDDDDDYDNDLYEDDDEFGDDENFDDDDELYDDDELADEDSDDDTPLDGMSYPFDSRYDYDANDLSYDDKYGLGAEDADDFDAISEDRESMHLGLSSFYSMRANEEMVLWKNGLYYPESAIHEMPPTNYKYLDESAKPYKVPVRRRRKK